MLKTFGIAVLVVALACLGGFLWLVTVHGAAGSDAGTKLDPQNFAQIEKGRYLTAAADCQGCHTVDGRNEPFAGGRAIETPFGSLVSPNITPDRETGIGAWSDDEFVAALLQGKRRDGMPLYPAMPFPYYTKLSRDDALAIRAYLNTLKPVHNPVAVNTLPFPFNIRPAMLVWDMLYFKKGRFQADRAKSAEWNRGAYLVEGPGHCGACHTPKTLIGGDIDDRKLQGDRLQGWFAPNITNDPTRGLGKWSIADIVAYLKSGHNALTAAAGIMAEEISLSSSKMTDADLKAIAVYLKDQPGSSAAPAPLASSSPVMKAGAAIYQDVCSACHAPDGKGVPNLFPSLAASSNVRSADPTSLIRVVLEGARSVATPSEPTGPGMPAFGRQLNDSEIAAVLTFVRNAWGSGAAAVSEKAVRDQRKTMAAKNH